MLPEAYPIPRNRSASNEPRAIGMAARPKCSNASRGRIPGPTLPAKLRRPAELITDVLRPAQITRFATSKSLSPQTDRAASFRWRAGDKKKCCMNGPKLTREVFRPRHDWDRLKA